MAERDTYQMAGGTAAQWAAANPTLLLNQDGIESDTFKRKTGDGSTPWSDLGYSAGPTQTSGSSIYAASVSAIAALKALNAGSLRVGDRIWVDGYLPASSYYQNHAMGGGAFVVIDSTAADDGGHLIAPNTPSGNKKYWRIGANPMCADPFHFGGIGDNVASDQKAIANAYASVRAFANKDSGSGTHRRTPGASIMFQPAPVAWKMTDTIEIDTATIGCVVAGASGIPIIRQHTKGKPCFTFKTLPNVSNDWPANLQRMAGVRDLWFEYEPSIGTSDKTSTFINLDNSSGGAVHTLFIDRCYFRNCYTAIKCLGGNMTMTLVRDCWFQGYAGTGIDYSAASVGTHCRVSNCNFQSTSSPAGTYAIHAGGLPSFHIENNTFESNKGASPVACHLKLLACNGFVLYNNRWEWGKIRNGEALISTSSTFDAGTIRDCEFTNMLVSEGETGYLINNGWVAPLKVEGMFIVDKFDANSKGDLYLAKGNSQAITWDAQLYVARLESADRIYGHTSNHDGVDYPNAQHMAFKQTSVPSTQAFTTLSESYVANSPSTIVKLVARYSNTISSGSITMRLLINGVAVSGGDLVLNSGNDPAATRHYGYRRDVDIDQSHVVNRGDLLEIQASTSKLSASGGKLNIGLAVVPYH